MRVKEERTGMIPRQQFERSPNPQKVVKEGFAKLWRHLSNRIGEEASGGFINHASVQAPGVINVLSRT